jgi:hypothetical protein
MLVNPFPAGQVNATECPHWYMLGTGCWMSSRAMHSAQSGTFSAGPPSPTPRFGAKREQRERFLFSPFYQRVSGSLLVLNPKPGVRSPRPGILLGARNPVKPPCTIQLGSLKVLQALRLNLNRFLGRLTQGRVEGFGRAMNWTQRALCRS